MGTEVVFFDGEIIGDIFNGAVVHEEEDGFVAGAIAEVAENDVNYLAFGRAKGGNLFGAGFVIRIEVICEVIPVDGHDAVVVVEAPAV